MTSRPLTRFIPLVLALAAALAAAAPAAAAVRHVKKNLTPTGKAPDARGRANLVVHGSKGRLGVVGRRLRGSASFEVIVDTVHIGTLTTNAAGSGKAHFNTNPHGRDQLLGTDPSGKLLEVRDDEGDDVLETEMPDDSEPGATRCCITDEEESECEEKTPDECAAEGGVDMGAGSCMPDPCPTPPGAEQVQCCQADHDEDGPECELSSAAECAGEGGTSLGAGTCDPNPCPATPPPAGEVACCVPDGGAETEESDGGDDGGDTGDTGGECERTTDAGCTALGGISMGDVSCDPDPCGATPATTTTTTPGETTTTTTVP